MPVSHEASHEFIRKVEQAGSTSLNYREELAFLHDLAQSNSLRAVFDEITFYAKFVVHAYGILNRVGSSGEETAKMSSEFESALAKVTGLIKEIVREAPEDEKLRFEKRFFSPSHESLAFLLKLLQDLSRIKNYMLDRERLQH